jgi:hypothetical protein
LLFLLLFQLPLLNLCFSLKGPRSVCVQESHEKQMFREFNFGHALLHRIARDAVNRPRLGLSSPALEYTLNDCSHLTQFELAKLSFLLFDLFQRSAFLFFHHFLQFSLCFVRNQRFVLLHECFLVCLHFFLYLAVLTLILGSLLVNLCFRLSYLLQAFIWFLLGL